MSLVEGVDFDVMGPVLYEDPMIRIVESGGIPIYTAVGYTGDIGSEIEEGDICAPGKGLKTFDRLHKNNEEPKLRSDPELLKSLSKKFKNMTPENKKRLNKKYDNMVNYNIWKFNNVPEKERAVQRNKYQYSNVRQTRFDRDSTYGSHIFFRAPSTWPHKVKADKSVSLEETLKGTNITDFHMKQTLDSLLQGAEPGEVSSLGVVIRVDPNKTFVYSSSMRVSSGITAELIYASGIPLSDYLIQIREKGPGYVSLEFEVYVTPPEGFLPYETFSECLIRDGYSQDFTIKSKVGQENYKNNDNTPDKSLVDLYRAGSKIATSLILKRGRVIDFYYENLFNELEYLEDLSKLPRPPPEQKEIEKYVVKIRKMPLEPLKRIKSKIFPYIIKCYGVITSNTLDKIKEILSNTWNPPANWRQNRVYIKSSFSNPAEIINEMYEEALNYQTEYLPKLSPQQFQMNFVKFTDLGKIMFYLLQLNQSKPEAGQKDSRDYILQYLDTIPDFNEELVGASAAKGAVAGGLGGARRKSRKIKNRKSQKSRVNRR